MRGRSAADGHRHGNQQIKQLARVLNSPSVSSGTTTSASGVRAMYKWHDGHFYVFAGNREETSTRPAPWACPA